MREKKRRQHYRQTEREDRTKKEQSKNQRKQNKKKETTIIWIILQYCYNVRDICNLANCRAQSCVHMYEQQLYIFLYIYTEKNILQYQLK